MNSSELKKSLENEITPFAVTTFRNRERVFGIKTDDRRRHVYIVGKTGMGKTTLIENMVYSDIVAGHGVCYVDPHGDTAEKMLEWIPSERINDVLYFNPADLHYPISFNVLEKVSPEYRHLVASGLIGVFKKLWADSWGPRLEYILRHSFMALLEYPDSTLLGVNRMLVDKAYRKKVVDKVTDPVVRSFWVDEFPRWNERVLQEVISPIQNKVGQFLSTALIRNVVGQVRSSFNLRELMDQKKILILNLSKGRIGEDASALFGAMMITKIQLAAMSRVDIAEDQRNDFYLYVDEFQNFATESFADILSEARKYRLNLIIAHQYIEQLGEIVAPAVFGNVGTMICFRVGAADAEFLEKEFAPDLTQEDLVNLPKFNIYLKLMIDGVASEPFSAKGLPPVYSESLGNEEKVIKVSRERYAKSRDVVEDKIRRWSLSEASRKAEADYDNKNEQSKKRFDDRSPKSKSQPARPGQSQNNTSKPGSSNSRPSENKDKKQKPKQNQYQAVCYNCKKDIEVPFKPDNIRPVFCQDCLKKARRGEIKLAENKNEEIKKENSTVEKGIPLNQIKEQTVNFKNKQQERIEPPQIPTVQPQKQEKRIEPPQIPNVQPQKQEKRIEPPQINFVQPVSQSQKEEALKRDSAIQEQSKSEAIQKTEQMVKAPEVKSVLPEKDLSQPETKKVLPSANLLSSQDDDEKKVDEGETIEL